MYDVCMTLTDLEPVHDPQLEEEAEHGGEQAGHGLGEEDVAVAQAAAAPVRVEQVHHA